MSVSGRFERYLIVLLKWNGADEMHDCVLARHVFKLRCAPLIDRGLTDILYQGE